MQGATMETWQLIFLRGRHAPHRARPNNHRPNSHQSRRQYQWSALRNTPAHSHSSQVHIHTQDTQDTQVHIHTPVPQVQAQPHIRRSRAQIHMQVLARNHNCKAERRRSS